MPISTPYIPPHLDPAATAVLAEEFKSLPRFDIDAQALAGDKMLAVACRWAFMPWAPESVTFEVLVLRFPFEGAQSYQTKTCTLTKSSPTPPLMFDFSATKEQCVEYYIVVDSKRQYSEWDENNNFVRVKPWTGGSILGLEPKF